MWVARDDNGSLWLYCEKPIRTWNEWVPRDPDDSIFSIPQKSFPNLLWENEPLEVELVGIKS